MLLPKTIKIGAHTVTLELVDSIKDGEIAGRWDAKKNHILLDKTFPPSQIQATLLHEIIHALNIDINEREVEFLSQGLYQVMADNDLIFDGKEVL